MSALYVDERKPGCNGFHLQKDFIYFTPNDTDRSTNGSAWRLVASGDNLVEKYKVLTGDLVQLRYSAASPPVPAAATPPASPGGRRMLSDAPVDPIDPIDPGLDGIDVLTGDLVQLRYSAASPPVPAAATPPASPGGRRMLSDAPVDPIDPIDPGLDGIDVLSATEGHEIYTGETIRVKSMVYILSMCGWPASMTVEVRWGGAAQRLFFTGSSNIKDYTSSCSYGKSVYEPTENFIVGNIDVNCSGTVASGSLKYAYDSSTKCDAAEQFAWRLAGDAAGRAAGYGDFMDNSLRRRIIMILPREVKCQWAGLGSVGCGGRFCTVYIKGSTQGDIGVYFHELGHTQGLSHAGKGLVEYGDTSDVMGDDGSSTQGYLCTNSGNMFRIGWNAPLASLSPALTNIASNMGVPGRWLLPATSAADVNFVALNYSFVGVPFPNLFISFRVRADSYDNILSSSNNNRVFVHVFNGTASDRDYNRTNLVATLSSGGIYRSGFADTRGRQDAGGGVRVSVLSINTGVSATIQLCRFTELVETNCEDTIDNDCNGLTDAEDPACRATRSPQLNL
ncbi:Autolysin [Tetrabaena socialis]|uniref:Autolysin n=1 Tax=Tetrabaena socialis TaxID=47790 RepID=A0A2J8AHG3_9CHLO|nr:Autolysin [Tetrabaena socialis]|eukprot:PNH11957.1 Autolysin [Tetrabaena socialis]